MLPFLFDENPQIKQDPDGLMPIKLSPADFDCNLFHTQVGYTNPAELMKQLDDPNIEKTLMEFVEGLVSLENLGVDLNLGSLLNTPPSSPDHEPEGVQPELEATFDFSELVANHVEPLDICGGDDVWNFDFTNQFTEAVANPVMLDDAWMGPCTSQIFSQNNNDPTFNRVQKNTPTSESASNFILPNRSRSSVSSSSMDSNDSDMSAVSSVFSSTFRTITPTPSSDIKPVVAVSTTPVRTQDVIVPNYSGYHGPLSDHSYHDVRGAKKNDWLGVQTPSDSEDDEEVDVVAVPQRRSNLPQIPNSQTQRQIQKQMAVVVAKKNVIAKQTKCRTAIKQRVSRPSSPSLVPLKIGGLSSGRPAIRNENVSNKKRGKNSRYHCHVSDERREDHNSNERVRRSDLKNLYLQLNSLLPPEDVGSKQRSKANILLGAIREAELLRQVEENCINTKKVLEAKRRKLMHDVEMRQTTLQNNMNSKTAVSLKQRRRW